MRAGRRCAGRSRASMPDELAAFPVRHQRGAVARKLTSAPDGVLELLLPPPPVSLRPGQPVFPPVIGPVAQAGPGRAPHGFDRNLRYRSNVVQKGPAGDPQLEARLARARKNLFTPEPPQPKVIINRPSFPETPFWNNKKKSIAHP